MSKLYLRLRREMFAQKVTQADLALHLGASQTYVSNRFSGMKSWSLADAYAILDFLQLPYSNFLEVFPKGGVAPELPKRRRLKLVAVE